MLSNDCCSHLLIVAVAYVQYFCVGMSLWDQERMKANSKKAVLPGDPVELPYCEGLQIISASQIQPTPVILSNDAGISAAAAAEQPSSSGSEPPQRPSRCAAAPAP